VELHPLAVRHLPDLETEIGAGITCEIDADRHGDLHMTHAHSFEAAKDAVGAWVRPIEDLAATA